MRKVLSVIKSFISWFIVALAVFMMVFTIISVNMFGHAERSLFGFRAFIVLSDSMSATDFDSGDVILVKNVNPDTLESGDIITFTSNDPDSFGEVITHKIRERTVDAIGNPVFVTYGTTTGANDRTTVRYADIIGQYQFAIPYAGTFFQYLRTTPGYICCILIPFMLLILLNAVNSIQLFRQYRKEQVDEMNATKEQIEKERMEAQRTLEELRALQAQMGMNTSGTPPTEVTPPTRE